MPRINRALPLTKPMATTEPYLLSFKFREFKGLPFTPRAKSVGSPPNIIDGHGHIWNLKLYPGGGGMVDVSDSAEGTDDESDVDRDIDVCLRKFDGTKVEAKVTIIVRDSTGKSFRDITYDDVDSFAKESSAMCYSGVAMRSEILDEANNILLPDGGLAIDVEIQILSKSEGFEPTNPAATNMLKFLEKGDKSDVSFKVEDVLIPAHKLILQMNAPMLADFCEKNDDESPIVIKDTKPEVFRFALQYIYGGDAPDEDNVHEMGKAIIEVANRFEIVGLKLAVEHACVELRVVKVENFADWFLFADAHTCPYLKEWAKSYFTVRSRDIMAHESYQKVKESPDLLTELMEAMAKAPKSYFVDVGRMSVIELRTSLDEMGLDVDGSKEMLVSRFKEAQNKDGEG